MPSSKSTTLVVSDPQSPPLGRLQLLLQEPRRIDERVHVVLALELGPGARPVLFVLTGEVVAVDLVAALDQGRVNVDGT